MSLLANGKPKYESNQQHNTNYRLTDYQLVIACKQELGKLRLKQLKQCSMINVNNVMRFIELTQSLCVLIDRESID